MTGFKQRFGGVGRLFSTSGLERLRTAHVCVVGIGGVGTWTVEALARSGVGELTLVDFDDVCITNTNRQIHAVQGELGKPKVEAMERRVKAINPDCKVNAVQAFFLKTNAEELLATRFDYVVDAIDSPSRKALLIAMCRERALPIITTGGAGGRRDPAAIEVTDLAASSHDRLLMAVRRLLRREYGFQRKSQLFGVECVLSREPAVFPGEDGTVCVERPEDPDLRLDCKSGYGTACFVTGTFGFIAASRVVLALTQSNQTPPTAEAREPRLRSTRPNWNLPKPTEA
jgi:tRNA A37 threonylcarbamoyladenosine dehydratase